MAGSKGSKYYDIFLKHQVQLVTKDEDIVINEEGFKLLLEIDKEHSIVAAAQNMEISYRKAWGLLSDIEYVLGFPLTKKRRGGQAGGMTSLTREGKELINAYGLLRNDLNSSAKEVIRVFFRRINAITDKK
jgi:molybdate transport system regulatory protein